MNDATPTLAEALEAFARADLALEVATTEAEEAIERRSKARERRDAAERALGNAQAAELSAARLRLLPPDPGREGRFRCGSPNKPPEGSKAPFAGDDHWRVEPNGDRTCSFCGSLHEEDFVAIMEGYADGQEGYRFEPSTKDYKVYAQRPGVTNAGEGGIKFYGWHADLTPGPDLDRRRALYDRACQRAIATPKP